MIDPERLLTDEGERAIALACDQADPGSLAAATALRRHVDADLAAAALDQAALRRRARAKFGPAVDRMLLTAHGTEQATRPAVAAWRARRMAASGVRTIVDLGCGLGADALAFHAAGLDVVAVERDHRTAVFARHNLAGRARVIEGDAVAELPGLVAGRDPASVAVFCDPARRTERGRTWRVDQFSPPWDFVVSVLGEFPVACVKLGPGLPLELVPDDVEVRWVSEAGDVVEAALWRLPDAAPGRSVTLLPQDLSVGPEIAPVEPPVGDLSRYVVEPDGALLRAGLTASVFPGWVQLAPGLGYLTADRPVDSPWGEMFEVLEVLDPGEKSLRQWVRANRVGTLEIKKRAVDVDPAALRRRLKLAGPRAATLVLTPTTRGARALVVRRVRPGSPS
ncbi:MAG TPA: SAM-dependent methyltransferase [Propionibacteriaceae bacterium]|nr:SAM-dependent methyltransferase [Propionibacteriaceae bacterium]